MSFNGRIVGLAVTALAASGVANAQYTLNYSFKSIGSSTFPFTSAVIGDVNAYGHVAFAVNAPPAQRGVYIYTGVALPIKVIDGSGYISFGRPDINCHDSVVVRAQKGGGGGDDMLLFNGGASPVVMLAGNGDAMSDPAINDFDEIAFVQQSWQELIYAYLSPGSVPSLASMAAVANPSDDIASFGPRVDINNAGEIAYGCNLPLNAGTEIRKISSGGTCVVFKNTSTAAKNIFSVALNGLGYVGFLQPTDYRVGNCGATSLLVNNPGGIAFASPLDMNWHFGTSWEGQDSLSGAAESGIYGGPAPATDKILRVGQSFPPDVTKTIAPAAHAGGINNRGQVSFVVPFTDGTWAIGRADPFVMTPEPEGCPGFAPDNDLMANAYPVSDGGWNLFSNSDATTDGPALDAQCEKGFGLSFEADVWFSYVASQTGCVAVSLCDFATFDTRLAVYVHGGLEVTAEDLVACNDDSCGLASRLVFPAIAGASYLIRVGGYDGATGEAILTVGPTDEWCLGSCGPDIDCNGIVDGADLGALLASWGTSGAGDLDGNGIVDGADLGALLAAWGG
ncbi:MAG: hypothetical protein U0575_05915 [Phycisphaerales bacterium]